MPPLPASSELDLVAVVMQVLLLGRPLGSASFFKCGYMSPSQASFLPVCDLLEAQVHVAPAQQEAAEQHYLLNSACGMPHVL
jgi:hypothetical protein